MRIMLLFLAVMLFLVQPEKSAADDVSDIATALVMCPSELKDCRPTGQTVVKVLLIRAGYAKASIRAADGRGETDIAYLKWTNGRWVVLDQGTGVNPYELGIPEGICDDLVAAR
jgi:hypothetical protein